MKRVEGGEGGELECGGGERGRGGGGGVDREEGGEDGRVGGVGGGEERVRVWRGGGGGEVCGRRRWGGRAWGRAPASAPWSPALRAEGGGGWWRREGRRVGFK